jgi:CheY-like chemotaxis protein
MADDYPEEEHQTKGALKLAELVAEETAKRFVHDWEDQLDHVITGVKTQFAKEMGKLRDDLTVRGLLCATRCRAIPDPIGIQAKVLLADDNPEVLRAFARILTSVGFEVILAASGAEAADLLHEHPDIDVIVSDIAMPKNGLSLLEHVRAEHPSVEIIMVSGYNTEADEVRKLGAFGFIAKPFNICQAVLLVERAAEFRRLKLACAAPATPPTASTP